MNDNELDELLNTRKTSPTSASLRERVPVGIVVRHKRLSRQRFLVAAAAVSAVVFLLTNTSAFSEKVIAQPYTVDSEIILHPGTPGCPNCWMEGPKHALMTSYNQAGSEVLLSWSAPDDPLGAVFWTAKLMVSDVIERFKHRFLLEPDPEAEDHAVVYWAVGQSRVLAERVPLVNSGCRPLSRQGQVVGQDFLLNYPTIVSEYHYWKMRVTLWMAPPLSCFALRATVEAEQADGSWTVVSEKKALKVTVNR